MDRIPRISVIVPVFNAEEYLPDCISSIQNQRMQDWELILVDDGSTDGSLSFCEACSQKDPRIRVFHKDNGGVSSARNFGIQKANGEWITFIDADDRIPSDFIPESFSGDIDLYLTNVKNFPYTVDSMWIEPRVIGEKDYLKFIEENAHWVVLMAPWGKFIRRELIVSNGISFDTRFRLCEDTLFDMQIERYCRSAVITESYYCYRMSSNENWAKKYHYKPDEALCYFDTFLDYYKDLGIHSPTLVSFVFTNISKIMDKMSMPRLQWAVQPQVLEMKRLMKETLTKKERIKYSFSRLLSFIHIFGRK